MKLTAIVLALVAFANAHAFAGPFGLPDHQPDGYRDTGCAVDARIEIKNDKGELLYTNNATCPQGGAATLDPNG